MKPKILFISNLVVFLIYFPIYSQNQIPSSPEVSNLIKPNTITVNESKGLLDFSIDLFELNVDNLNMPISLRYNSSGVKIEEEANNVGTSWNLSTGGVISRTQHGLPDEFTQAFRSYPTYDSYGFQLCDEYDIVNNVSYFDYSYNSNSVGNYLIDNGNLNNYNQSVGLFSMFIFNPEADLFTYTLPNGRKETFVINNRNSISTTSNDRINVFFDSLGNISSFTITDVLGNEFFFNEIEERNNSYWNTVFHGSQPSIGPAMPALLNVSNTYSSPTNPCVEGSQYGYSNPGVFSLFDRVTNVGWFLTKILTVNCKVIELAYQNERHSRLSNTDSYYNENATISKFNIVNRLDNYVTKRLKQIKFPNGKITLIYQGNKREDVKDSSNLNDNFFNTNNSYSELEAVKSIYLENNNGQLIKKVDFFTSYRISDGILSASNSNKYLYKRLWLDGIKINNTEEYDFEYNTGTLPYKFSYQQDYWGYFNDNKSDINNKSMFPDLWFYPDDPKSYTRLTNFSIFKRNNFVGSEYKLSTLPRFSNVLGSYLSNRDINETSIQNGMLVKVILPTKGFQNISYESNEFLFENETKKGFGLRIKKIESFDNNGNPLGYINYNYLKDDGTSSGTITNIGYFGRISGKNNANNSLLYTLGSSSMDSNFTINYSRVEKKNQNNGKIISEYFIPFSVETDHSMYNNGKWFYSKNFDLQRERIPCYVYGNCLIGTGVNTHEVYSLNTVEYSLNDLNVNYENLFGKLLNQYYYNESDILMKKIENNYTLSSSSTKIANFFGNSADTTVNNLIANGQQRVKTYSMASLLLSSTKLTEIYNFNYTNIKQIDFSYNSKNLLSSQSSINSKGETILTNYDYSDSSLFTFNSDISDMKTLHMLNYPIITSTFKNGNLISKKFNRYHSESNNNPFGIFYPIVLSEEFNLETNKPINDFNDFNWFDPLQPNFGQIDSRLKSIRYYHNYDLTNGNLQEYSEKGGRHIVYIWGYNKTQIIAKIENIKYSDIPQSTILNLQTLSDNDTDNCNTTSCSEQILRNALDNLRTTYTNSMITTYTYDPLIGVTSITDSNGKKQIFTYDYSGKLENIKDENENILNNYQYHYKN